MIYVLLFLSHLSLNAHAVLDAKPSNPIDGILTTEMLQGIRDPFQMPTILNKRKEAPKAELELVQLKDIKLNGVITGPKKARALLSIPNGKTFFISVGDHVGIRGGHISRIRPEAVTIVEYDSDENGKKVSEEFEIQMNGEVVSLSDDRGGYR